MAWSNLHTDSSPFTTPLQQIDLPSDMPAPLAVQADAVKTLLMSLVRGDIRPEVIDSSDQNENPSPPAVPPLGDWGLWAAQGNDTQLRMSTEEASTALLARTLYEQLRDTASVGSDDEPCEISDAEDEEDAEPQMPSQSTPQ